MLINNSVELFWVLFWFVGVLNFQKIKPFSHWSCTEGREMVPFLSCSRFVSGMGQFGWFPAKRWHRPNTTTPVRVPSVLRSQRTRTPTHSDVDCSVTAPSTPGCSHNTRWLLLGATCTPWQARVARSCPLSWAGQWHPVPCHVATGCSAMRRQMPPSWEPELYLLSSYWGHYESRRPGKA